MSKRYRRDLLASLGSFPPYDFDTIRVRVLGEDVRVFGVRLELSAKILIPAT